MIKWQTHCVFLVIRSLDAIPKQYHWKVQRLFSWNGISGMKMVSCFEAQSCTRCSWKPSVFTFLMDYIWNLLVSSLSFHSVLFFLSVPLFFWVLLVYGRYSTVVYNACTLPDSLSSLLLDSNNENKWCCSRSPSASQYPQRHPPETAEQTHLAEKGPASKNTRNCGGPQIALEARWYNSNLADFWVGCGPTTSRPRHSDGV